MSIKIKKCNQKALDEEDAVLREEEDPVTKEKIMVPGKKRECKTFPVVKKFFQENEL
jgi:hypothetical protein